MHRKGGSGGGIHRVSLIFEAIEDDCGETPIFLYPALGNLNIHLQVPIGLVSHLPWLPSTLTGKVAVYLVWQHVGSHNSFKT